MICDHLERCAETAGVDNWWSQRRKNHCILGNATICEKNHAVQLSKAGAIKICRASIAKPDDHVCVWEV